jgi:chemotaxis protein MotB
VRRKKHNEEQENAERWLLTYADLITLLLAFFIMMYTFSKRDAQKYEEVTSHLKAIFAGGQGIAGKGSVSATNPLPLPSRGESSGDMKRQLESEIISLANNKGNNNGIKQNISVLNDGRGIVIRVMDRAFFDEGKAELKERAKGALDKIVPIIKGAHNHISIEGHTDNVPINTHDFKSNWELSVRRSTEVVRYFVERHGFPPERISASGYAEYRPIVDNDTAENRALNRRIEIIIMKDQEKPLDPEKTVFQVEKK